MFGYFDPNTRDVSRLEKSVKKHEPLGECFRTSKVERNNNIVTLLIQFDKYVNSPKRRQLLTIVIKEIYIMAISQAN